MILVAAALAGVIAAPTATAPSRVVGVRTAHHPEYDRIVLEFDRPPFLMSAPEISEGEIVLDIGAEWRGAEIPRRSLPRIREVALVSTPVGLRLTVRGAGSVRAFRLRDPPRIVVDLGDSGTSGFESPPGTEPLERSPRLREPRAEGGEPPCARSCVALAEKGELRPGLPLSSCMLRLCRQAALRLYEEGQYEEALAAVDHVRVEGARPPASEVDRGIILYALGRFDEALIALDGALEVSRRSFRARAERARTLVRLHRLEEARAELEPLVAEVLSGSVPFSEDGKGYGGLRPSSYLLGNLGVLELCEGKVAAGRSDLERALKADDRNVQAATMLESAVPALDAGTLAPEGVWVLEGAFEDLGLGRLDDAVAQFEGLAERWPRFEQTWWLVGGIHFSRLEYSACEDVFARAEVALPEVTDFRVERIRCRILRYGEGSEERRAAVAELRALAESHPGNRRALDLLAVLQR